MTHNFKFGVILLIGLCPLSSQIFAQNAKSKEETTDLVWLCPIEKTAQPRIGYDSLYTRLIREIQTPKTCFEGKVFMSFEVDTLGNVLNIEIVKGVHNRIDQEVMRAFRQLDFKFYPAELMGKKVRSRMIIPIMFKL